MEWVGWVISGAGLLVTIIIAIVTVVSRLSSKLYQVEIWARDEFVRKNSFEAVVNRIEKDVKDLGKEVRDKFDKIMERLERIPHN